MGWKQWDPDFLFIFYINKGLARNKKTLMKIVNVFSLVMCSNGYLEKIVKGKSSKGVCNSGMDY